MIRCHATLAAAALTAVALGLTACSRETALTSEEKRARGDARLRAMSDALGKAEAFSFETTEAHPRVRRNGEKVDVRFTREVKVRRPNGLWIHQQGNEREFKVWYDGKTLTLVGDSHKVFARAPVPATLDAMLDVIAERYDVPMPIADMLYASAHDSLVDKDTSGEWVLREPIEGRPCDRLAYQHKAVAFTLWISAEAPAVPCRLEVTYKDSPGEPTSRIAFRNWNLQATIAEGQFTAAIPPAYEEIPIVERVTKKELADELANAGASK